MGFTMSNRLITIVVGAVLQVAGVSLSAADESPLPNADYGVSTIWQLGGTGGWDYLALEPSGARLFVSRGDRVDVIETSSGRRAGIVPNTAGVHGIAFAPELKRGYTSNGRANSVTAFALDTLQVIQESQIVGKKPDAILYEPRLQHVFTADGASNDINVLDPMTLQVLTNITLPGPPEFMATDAAGTVFVNIETEAGKLVAIDAKSLKIKATWALPGCSNPTGLAIDAANHRLFSVCENQVMAVTDSVSGKQIARVAIGEGPDAAAFDRDLGFVFSSNGADGTLTVIHQETPDQYRVVATVQTQKSARTMALDPATHRIFLAAARLGDTPLPTPDHPHPRPATVPDTFVILIAEPK
jgi:DNA-binding beta-propeller fold protein YncE